MKVEVYACIFDICYFLRLFVISDRTKCRGLRRCFMCWAARIIVHCFVSRYWENIRRFVKFIVVYLILCCRSSIEAVLTQTTCQFYLIYKPDDIFFLWDAAKELGMGYFKTWCISCLELLNYALVIIKWQLVRDNKFCWACSSYWGIAVESLTQCFSSIKKKDLEPIWFYMLNCYRCC